MSDAPKAVDAAVQTNPQTNPQATPPAVPLAAPVVAPDDAGEPPRYWAWTDRWDPGKWETPDNPTPLQRVLAAIALVIVLVMTVYVPLRVLKIF